MADVERPALPATWTMEDDDLYCLACRRDRAGEAALAARDDATSAQERGQIESRARIEFEMKRRPDQEDSRIAKSCRTSIKAVQQARVRLGMPVSATRLIRPIRGEVTGFGPGACYRDPRRVDQLGPREVPFPPHCAPNAPLVGVTGSPTQRT